MSYTPGFCHIPGVFLETRIGLAKRAVAVCFVGVWMRVWCARMYRFRGDEFLPQGCVNFVNLFRMRRDNLNELRQLPISRIDIRRLRGSLGFSVTSGS